MPAAIPPPTRDNTCAVVVTYHPDAGLPERVLAVAAQVARVFVVDNGSGAATGAVLDRLAGEHGIGTVRNPQNRGIATALNQGLAAAGEAGFAWAVTLDQDSNVLPEFTAVLFDVYRRHPDPVRVGAIGSSNRDPEVDLTKHYRSFRRAPGSLDARTVITSGCLTAVEAWRQVGGFRDRLFIDCVDEEFCLRLRRHGWRVAQSREVGLVHRLGEMREYHLLGRALVATNHSPVRRYYMTRNAATLIAANVFREPLWAARKLQRQLGEWVGILAAESGKPQKIRAILLGLWHALSRRAGPVPPAAAARLAPPPPTGQK